MEERPEESGVAGNSQENTGLNSDVGIADDVWTFETQAQYDPDEPRDLTTVIICAIAEAEEVGILEIKEPPLYEVIDIASIEDALFGRPEATRNSTHSQIEFHYRNHKVSVNADGWVTVFGPVEKPLTDDE